MKSGGEMGKACRGLLAAYQNTPGLKIGSATELMKHSTCSATHKGPVMLKHKTSHVGRGRRSCGRAHNSAAASARLASGLRTCLN